MKSHLRVKEKINLNGKVTAILLCVFKFNKLSFLTMISLDFKLNVLLNQSMLYLLRMYSFS